MSVMVVSCHARYFLKGPAPKHHTMLATDVFQNDDKYSEWVKALVPRLQQ